MCNSNNLSVILKISVNCEVFLFPSNPCGFYLFFFAAFARTLIKYSREVVLAGCIFVLTPDLRGKLYFIIHMILVGVLYIPYPLSDEGRALLF